MVVCTNKYNNNTDTCWLLLLLLLLLLSLVFHTDTCVPYIGNEEWTTGLAESGVVTETSPWHPWYKNQHTSSPTGYATTYGPNFQFVTIRLAGHQVPKNMPEASLAVITALLDNKSL